jgi:hypothetical protein
MTSFAGKGPNSYMGMMAGYFMISGFFVGKSHSDERKIALIPHRSDHTANVHQNVVNNSCAFLFVWIIHNRKCVGRQTLNGIRERRDIT